MVHGGLLWEVYSKLQGQSRKKYESQMIWPWDHDLSFREVVDLKFKGEV